MEDLTVKELFDQLKQDTQLPDLAWLLKELHYCMFTNYGEAGQTELMGISSGSIEFLIHKNPLLGATLRLLSGSVAFACGYGEA